MKYETVQALKDFIFVVKGLAHSVSSVAGTDQVELVYEACDKLTQQLTNEIEE